MQIKIRNSIVIKNEFADAVNRLLQSRSMPAKACLELNIALDELATQAKILRKARRDITLRYCCKDKDGEAVSNESHFVVFPDAESEKACHKEFEELFKEYTIVEMTNPVTIYADENVTPQDLRLLGGLVQVGEREVK